MAFMECSHQLSVDHWSGRKLGRYEISEVLGAGKKGFVLRAYDPAMEREVAIRVLTEQLSADELERRRFLFGQKAPGNFSMSTRLLSTKSHNRTKSRIW